MKIKMTRSAIQKSNRIVVHVPYGMYGYIMSKLEAEGYYADSLLGWRADYYNVTSGVGITTGYTAIGIDVGTCPHIKAVLEEYNDKAREHINERTQIDTVAFVDEFKRAMDKAVLEEEHGNE